MLKDHFSFYTGTNFGNAIVEVFREQDSENSGEISEQYLNIFILFPPQLEVCKGTISNIAKLVQVIQYKNVLIIFTIITSL